MSLTVETGETETSVEHKKSGLSKKKSGKTKPTKTDGTSVTLSMGHTKNIGNFESVKIEVGVTIPTTQKDIEKAYKLAKGWCDKKLTELIDEVEDSLDG